MLRAIVAFVLCLLASVAVGLVEAKVKNPAAQMYLWAVMVILFISIGAFL